MKRLTNLKVEDLLACPVWRYDGASDADAFLTPASRTQLTDEPCDLVFIALTEFVLANGQKHLGYSSPADSSGLDYVQPVIIVDGDHIALWSDEQGKVSREIAVRLGLDEGDTFPVTWRCLVPVDGDVMHGVIPAAEINTLGQ